MSSWLASLVAKKRTSVITLSIKMSPDLTCTEGADGYIRYKNSIILKTDNMCNNDINATFDVLYRDDNENISIITQTGNFIRYYKVNNDKIYNLYGDVEGGNYTEILIGTFKIVKGSGGSPKILYKGRRYKLRIEGRSKYILCKGAKVPLKDVRAWQKGTGKK